MLYRKFYKNAETSTLLQFYVSYIRPHLEYCSAFWDPYIVKDMEILEKTQKFALKVCLKDWSSNYTTTYQLCHQGTLRPGSLTFEIIHEQTDFSDVPIDQRISHYHSRFDNSMAIKPFQCRSSQFLNSFVPRTSIITVELSTNKCCYSCIQICSHRDYMFYC